MEKEKKIQLIRECINKNRYPLKYEWRNCYQESNCYAYAIGSSYIEDRHSKEYIYNLGSVSNYAPPNSKEEAEEAFVADMQVLGIRVRKSNLEEKMKEGEWKVVLFFDCYYFYNIPFRDFHFARQNIDGNWSHKEFIEGPVRVLGSTPEYASDLDLVGYYILKVEEK